MNFPTDLLKPEYTGLCLYGAGFLGRNDGVYLRDAGMMDVVVVDIDCDKLEKMETHYPSSWKFVCSDVDEFMKLDLVKFDVVCVDPPIARLNNEEINHWTRYANHLVVVTATSASLIRRRVSPGTLFTLENAKTWVVDRIYTRSVEGGTNVVVLVPN